MQCKRGECPHNSVRRFLMETEGQLVYDPLLKCYKLVDPMGKQDHRLQAGEQIELLIAGQWVPVNIGLFGKGQDKWAWKFTTEQKESIFPTPEQRARLIHVEQQQKRR